MTARELALLQGGTTASPPSATPKSPYRSKLEARYAMHLEALRLDGQIAQWTYEPVKFRLGLPGRRCWYTIDFEVVVSHLPGHVQIEYHAVTGYTRDDARVKIEAVANLYSWYTFVIIREDRHATCEGWTREVVGTKKGMPSNV